MKRSRNYTPRQARRDWRQDTFPRKFVTRMAMNGCNDSKWWKEKKNHEIKNVVGMLGLRNRHSTK